MTEGPFSFATRSLTARLISLTVLFVLAAELVVLIPSVSKQRMDWFKNRIEGAYLVSVALEGPRGRFITESDARMLFETAGIRGVTVMRGDSRALILAREIDPHGAQDMHRVDMTDMMPTTLIANAWGTIFSDGDALIQVSGQPRQAPDRMLEIIVSQRDLREDLLAYTRNILALSLVISIFTAGLLFYALNRIIVRPVKRLTQSMTAFEEDPDRAALIHVASARSDEIGAAERRLAAMQRRISDLLGERRRLAALGAGISKISHDLRNILASAQLMSDRLVESDDPAMRKLSPRLIGALDRAIALCRDTLAFGAMEASKLSLTRFELSGLVDEVLDDVASLRVGARNEVAEDFEIVADRTQLYRALFNLARNAVEAMTPDLPAADNDEAGEPAVTGELVFSTRIEGETVTIQIKDNGPGLPDHAREALFEPFKGSRKAGGSGLGVAISAEIARAHGGTLSLMRSDSEGTVFEFRLVSLSDVPENSPRLS